MKEMFRIDLDELCKLADKQEWMVEKEFLLAVAKELEELRAKIEGMEKQEPVAEVGHVYTLNWCGFDPVTHIVKRHNLKVGDKLFTAPGAQPAPSVPDDVIEQAVNRFLSWKLPKDFHPDGGMVFIPTKQRGYDSPYWPIGTNLLTADQAREMLRYVLAAAPESEL